MGWKGTLRSLEASARRAERDSVRRQRELERQRQQYAKMQEMERAAYEVQVYENYVDVLISIHKDSSESWDWGQYQAVNPPAEPKWKNTFKTIAQRELDMYKPGVMDKLLKRVEAKREELADAVIAGNTKDEQNYQEALEIYEREYAEWKAIRELATKILSGDVSAYSEAIAQVNPFGEISQLGSAVEHKIVTSNLVEVTLHVNGEDVIPVEMKTLLKSGKLSVKKMPKTRFYELYQDYVCGGVLRVAREVCALLPVDRVIVSAVGELLNSQTGYLDKRPILSVVVPRETLNKLNFALLDPSDAMSNFVHQMKFMKTKGFQPIEKILPSDINV